MSIEVKQITKIFGSYKALDHVDLKIETGELIALLGPSGSGKTTLLRIIAGLETADQGTVMFHGEDTKDKRIKDRGVGFVFQHYALFRHMTVFENIAFGLRVKPKECRLSEQKIKDKVYELLKLVQLEWVAARFPSQLSGGQRQRIALARALAIEPKVLLLDEPFGSLDAQVRNELRQWLRRFHDELHVTSLFVTHDQEEALEVADRIVVMNRGHIEQVGTPDQVYHNPANVFVLNFLGKVNLFHARVEDGRLYVGSTPIEIPGLAPEQIKKSASLYVRPHQFEISLTARSNASFKAKVKFVSPAGAMVKVDLINETGQPIQAEITREEALALGIVRDQNVFVTLKEVIYSEFEI